MYTYTNKDELLRDVVELGSFRGDKDKIFEQVSPELLEDNDVVVELIKHNQELVNPLGDIIFRNPELMNRVFDEVDSTLYHRLSDEYKNNEQFMLQLLKYDSNAKYNIGEDLRNNEEFMRKAVKVDEESVRFAEKSIKEKLEKEMEDRSSFEQRLKNILDEEKYKLILSFPETRKMLLKVASETNIEVLEGCIKKLNEKNLDLTEWTRGMEKLTDNMQSQEYRELLSIINVNEIDMEALYNLLQNPNYYNIKNAEDLKNYEKIKQEVCDAIINGDHGKINEYPEIAQMEETERLQFAVLQKQYGIDVKDAKTIWSKCGDIDEIKNDSLPNVKSYIESIIRILQEKSKEVLKNVYNVEKVKSNSNVTLETLSDAKKIYAKEFNETLFNPSNGENIQDTNEYLKQNFRITDRDLSDVKIVDAGTEFNMIITSIGAYSDGSFQENDYYKSWNREINGTSGVSCSYIGNDMRATAPISEFCFGFNDMAEDSLLMQSTGNLGSTTEKERLTIKNMDGYIENLTPENLKDNTGQYNEIVYNRMQNGERKQPDYIVIFKNGDRTEGNIESALMAVENFKAKGIDLPIVVVDIQKCKQAEKNRLDCMIEEYKHTKDGELKKSIESKIKRNRKTDNMEFTIYYKKLGEAEKYQEEATQEVRNENKDSYIERSVGITDFQTAYKNTSIEERREEVRRIMNMSREMEKNMELGR